MTTPCGSNPGLTWLSVQRLRTRRPVPISSTSASATSNATSEDRSRGQSPEPAALGEPAFSGWERSDIGGRTAGAMPIATVTRREISAVKPSIRASSAISLTRGNPAGAVARTTPIAHHANSKPSPAPASTTRMASVNRRRATRPRPAPSAARIASSRDRRAARTSVMFATLAHASSKTAATAAASKTSTGRTAPNCSSSSNSDTNSTRVQPRLSAG